MATLRDHIDTIAQMARGRMDALDMLMPEAEHGPRLSKGEQLDQYLNGGHPHLHLMHPGEIEDYHQAMEKVHKDLTGVPLKRRPF